MAQRKTSMARKARLLARRYGIGGRQAAVAALGFVLLMAALGFLHMRAQASFVVERDEEASQAESGGAEQKGEESTQASASASVQLPARVIVHVDGAVVAPGVYELEGADLRINDAVARAGGLRADADTSSMNLAQALSDGEKIHVPAVGEEPPVAAAGTASQATSTAQSQPSDQASGQATGAQATGGLVNINSASAQELMGLTGVGEATAEAIVQDREQNGPFETVEDLMRVPGIAEKKYSKLEGQICV